MQQSISCVSPAVVGYVPAAANTYSVSLRGQGSSERFLRLPGGSGVDFSTRYRVAQEPGERVWSATISAYRYSLSDHDGNEVLSYHWHPDTYSHVTTPHLHIGGGVAVWRPDLAKAHIPTGMVTLDAVLLLAIEELALDVQPLRAEWRAILTGTRDDIP